MIAVLLGNFPVAWLSGTDYAKDLEETSMQHRRDGLDRYLFAQIDSHSSDLLELVGLIFASNAANCSNPATSYLTA